MNEVTTQGQRNPLVSFKTDLKRLKDAGELDMLPANVSFEAFRNAAVVAITDNPQILGCNRESLFKAIRRLAAAGLVPDGREAAIVPFRGQAQAMPMVAGIIKTARNSGEITSIWADVVYDSEELKVWVDAGERKFDHIYNPLTRSGEITGAYAVAKLKDGTIEFEPMSKAEIEKRRKASANQKTPEPTGIWKDWYSEMAKKTVIRALCKRLPMSSEDMRRVMVEHEDLLTRDVTPREARPNLAQQLLGDPVDQRPTQEPEDESQDIEGEASHWTEAVDPNGAFPGADEFSEGAKAAQAGEAREGCPYQDDLAKACDWLGGWDGAQEAAA